MATTISASTTANTAFNVTPDTSGSLVIQTGATPTTALTISSSQIVSFANPPTATGAGGVSTNTAYGTSALAANTTGASNTAIGNQSLQANTIGANITAIGYQAGYGGTIGSNATFLGYQAGYGVNASTVVGVGYQALYSNTSGNANTAIGDYQTMYSNTSGSDNVAVGRQALFSNTTASNNTAVGYQAGYNNTGTNNVWMGYLAGYGIASSASGTRNTGIGVGALYSFTTGTSNIGVGINTLNQNTSGNYNVAIGDSALLNNSSANYNTAVGYQAGYSNTTGAQHVFIGYQAGQTQNGGTQCVYIGNTSGQNATAGTLNTFVGGGSGYLVTSGSYNTIIGGYTGNQGGLNITTSSNNIVLSDGAGNPAASRNGSAGQWYFGTGSLGNDGAIVLAGAATSGSGPVIQGCTGTYGSFTTQWYAGSNSWIKGGTTYNTYTITAGGSSGGVSLTSGATAWVSASDSRLKTVTGTYTTALADISQIQPVKFTWKDDTTNKPQVGVIAQSVQAVVPEAIDTVRHSKEDETDYLGVRYTELIPLMIASIQELNTLVTAQATTITALEAKLKAANVAGF